MQGNTGRRSFLKAAGGAAAAPLFAQQNPAANDRISIAFIGVGVMGTADMRAAMKQPVVAVTAVREVYQPQRERAVAVARKGGHEPKEIRDFCEILSDR